MTTPTGTISMTDIATELGISVTGLSLNDSRVRALAGVPSGPISMNDLRGKSNAFTTTPSGIWAAGGDSYYGYSSGAVIAGGGSITNNVYKGYTIAALYSKRWNSGNDDTSGLILVGNASASIPSLAFITPDGWGTISAVYSGGYTRYEITTYDLENNVPPTLAHNQLFTLPA